MSADFDWYGGDVVVQHQPETAVYINPNGAIVIRQRDEMGDPDPYVFLSPDAARRVVAAILDLLDQEAGASMPAAVAARPRNSTGAARQRRYRERQRDAVTGRDVTLVTGEHHDVTPLPLLAHGGVSGGRT